MDALHRYHEERIAKWEMLPHLASEPSYDPGAPKWQRHAGQELIRCIPGSGANLAKLAAQVGVHVPERKPA